MNRNTDKVDHILREIRRLKNKHAVLAAATGEDFNVFSILRIKHRETVTHTPILSELLNPDGSHHQKDAFLKLFLERCRCIKNDDSGNSDFYNNPKEYRVRSEERVDQAQFDIRLEKKDCCIVIENKIDASDQDGQLKRLYEDAIKSGFKKNQIKLVYLTLNGSPPSEASLKDPNGDDHLNQKDIKCISYSKDIIPWLEECMKLEAVQRIDSIREILLQYQNLLKDLTGQPTNISNNMELSDLLTKDENYELIPQLEQMLLGSKVQSQISFWQKLKNKLADYNIKKEIIEESLEDNVRNYYCAKRYKQFDVSFEIGEWKQSKIALSIENSPNCPIYYAFSLFQDGEWVTPCNNEKYKPLAEKLDCKKYKFTDEWHIGWKYPKSDLRFPHEYQKDDKKFLFLLDEKKERKQLRS